MKYDFETIMDRSGKDALAVDAIGAGVDWAVVPTKPKNGFSAIPMWVADMNFATVPTIPQAIIKRAEHPASPDVLCDAFFIPVNGNRSRFTDLIRDPAGLHSDHRFEDIQRGKGVEAQPAGI